jgi:serine/threonine protein kinase
MDNGTVSARLSDSLSPDDAADESLLEPTTAESSDRPAAGAEVSSARYEIVRKLGQGGAGAVYLVLDRDTGETLALKKLLRMDIQGVLRLKREFRSVADLHHPNLIKLYDLGRADDTWFITMEYLAGTDLITFLGSSGRSSITLRLGLPPGGGLETDGSALARLVAAFQQLASGIHALHRAGMLHRDLKPSNVLVASERVVVLDFGLIREMGGSAVTVTNDNLVSGTPAYMAPEQVRGSELGEATDWYAFGVMLYEALRIASGNEGQLQCQEAEQSLRELGIHDPGASVEVYLPELFMETS